MSALAALSGTAGAASMTFSNTTAIKTPLGKGVASPYPSAIEVSGMPGRVTDVVVRIPKFKVDYPDDVDILLVSPDDDASIVLSDVCAEDRNVERSFTFSDAVATRVPGGGPCDGGVYRPTNELTFLDVWPGAPERPHVADFRRFKGENPNGTWRLYVLDDLSGGKASELAQGWALTLTSAVPAATLPGPGADGRADVYPLTKTVDDGPGVIRDVNVSLSRVLHDRPDDLDLQLVGPTGRSIKLMSDVCGGAPFDGDLAWDDEADRAFPDGGPCPSGSYLPTDQERGDALPAPAPAGDELSLSAFDGTTPNGAWHLYASDDRPADAHGVLFQDFDLHFELRPPAAVGSRTREIEVIEGETGELTLVRESGGDPVGPGYVDLTVAPGGAEAGADFEPLAKTIVFEPGRREVTVPLRTLADDLPEGTESATLAIGAAQGDAAVPAGAPAIATVTIRDPAAPAGLGGGPAGPPLVPVRASTPSTTPAAADRDAPDTRIVRAPARKSAGRIPTFRFTADEAGSRFACRIDRGRFKPCRSGRRLPRLRAGRHTFAVRAIDAAGNTDPSPAKRTWRIVK